MKKSLVLSCLLLSLALVGCGRKAILLVTPYAPTNPRIAEMEKSIRYEMKQEKTPYFLETFNMDIVSQPTKAWIDERAHLATVHADAARSSVVFVAGDLALRDFAQRLIGKPLRMVYFDVVGDPELYKLNSSLQATGVIADVPVSEAFALMKQLVPNARGAAVLADMSPEGDAIVSKIQGAKLDIPVVIVKRAGNLKDWMAAVRDVQKKADVLCIVSYSTVLTEAEGTSAVPAADLLAQTAAVNRLPDFSFWKEAVGPNGVMAAVVVPVKAQAALATQMAIKLLYYNYTIADMKPVVCSAREPVINAERAATFGIAIPANIGTAQKTAAPEQPATPEKSAAQPAAAPATAAPGSQPAK